MTTAPGGGAVNATHAEPWTREDAEAFYRDLWAVADRVWPLPRGADPTDHAADIDRVLYAEFGGVDNHDAARDALRRLAGWAR